jgi:predicted RNA-binding Zn-ribbon protein involved in translation (DUF1610 family)
MIAFLFLFAPAVQKASGERSEARQLSQQMTTVLFVCPNCGAGYQVTQERLAMKASGTFGCQICRTEIYSWSGNYDYSDWKAYEANPKPRRQRRKK